MTPVTRRSRGAISKQMGRKLEFPERILTPAPRPTQCSGDLQPGALDSASLFSSVEKVGLVNGNSMDHQWFQSLAEKTGLRR
jgi:hypothetical protein